MAGGFRKAVRALRTAPTWHDAPPVPGVYVTRPKDLPRSPNGCGHIIVDDPQTVADGFPDYRFYGPIPADPQAGA